jgi:N-acetyl-anhydromuramyl-L-alanine amidase AmpD
MKTIKLGNSGNQVIFLQKLLQKKGYIIVSNGEFDAITDHAVKDFQAKSGLENDGIVGNNTWAKILTEAYSFSLGARNHLLNADEWMKEYIPKDTIYLHHTAGLHRPDFTIDGWETDSVPPNLNRVATAFVIGRKSLQNDVAFDGKVYRAFNEIYWAHHLGTTLVNNKVLNQKSIGIEICGLGPLVLENGKFLFKITKKNAAGVIVVVKTIEVPASEVCELATPWRGFKFFQKYTSAQIEATKKLVLTLAFLFDIPLENRLYDTNWFAINPDATNGKAGLWTHCNVRTDKTDCFPQPEFIAMLNSLHVASKTFIPADDSLEIFESLFVESRREIDPESLNYSSDLEDAKPPKRKYKKKI